MKQLLTSITVALFLLSSSAWAKKDAAPTEPPPPTAEQTAFTKSYWEAVEGGPEAFQKFSDSIVNDANSTPEQNLMLENLNKGKGANGGPPIGFRGDPADNGPSDWTNWEMEKDAFGRIKGFKEKNFKDKDTDGDGKISDAEREAWKKKKEQEDKDRGGPIGKVKKNPDWDKNGDGIPDPGFTLDCFRCYKVPQTKCKDGAPGGCGENTCDKGATCKEHTEPGINKTLLCHTCYPNDGPVDPCPEFGYSSSPKCDGKCPDNMCIAYTLDKKNGDVIRDNQTRERDSTITCYKCGDADSCAARGFFDDTNCEGQCNKADGWSCVAADVDKKSGQAIPKNQTRERGSTMPCFWCKKTIIVEYYVLIIETPYERFVLGQNAGPGFKPSSVMALAKSEPGTGKIKNVAGDLKNVTDFMGSMNVGFGPGGITSPGALNIDQLSGMLGKSLSGGGSYGANCFDDVENEADKQASSKGLPTSKDIKEGKTNPQEKGRKEKSLDKEEIKKSEEAGTPAVSGPIMACGQEDGNKVLKIYSAGGQLIDTVTQAMYKANPNVLLEKIGLAQNWTDKFMVKTGFDFAGYVEKFTGIPLKRAQEIAAQIQDVKAKADMALLSKKKVKKKKGAEEELPVIPNDPYYQAPEKKKKGWIGGEAPAQAPLGLQIGVIMPDAPRPKKEEIPDQYNLRQIGYTTITDPNSAWNVIDASQKNVVVAVVDSGLDFAHPDTPQYIWINPKEIPDNHIDDDGDGFVDDIHGWNFLNENHDFTDYRGHGTFVAGIIAAKTNNGIGIAGINPGAVIMPIKVANDEGVTDSLAIYRGINYAVNHGAKVINVSLGGRTISKLEQQAIERAYTMGALVIIAAGNGGDNLMTFGPSSSKHALTVGMLDRDGQRSNVSNWGANIALTASGERIYSLCSKDIKKILLSIRKEGYYQQDGTSFTTPMVAATASLMLAKNPQLTNEEIRDILVTTAKPVGQDRWSGMTGFGTLDAAAALRASAPESLIVMLTSLHINRDMSDRLSSIDLYGTVKGRFKEIIIEAGKGKLARSFNTIAGPFQTPYNYQLMTRLMIADVLRGSKEWIIRIKVIDEEGKEHIASMPLTLPDK